VREWRPGVVGTWALEGHGDMDGGRGEAAGAAPGVALNHIAPERVVTVSERRLLQFLAEGSGGDDGRSCVTRHTKRPTVRFVTILHSCSSTYTAMTIWGHPKGLDDLPLSHTPAKIKARGASVARQRKSKHEEQASHLNVTSMGKFHTKLSSTLSEEVETCVV
jgi:hypothetical protein